MWRAVDSRQHPVTPSNSSVTCRHIFGLPKWLSGKNPPASAGDAGSIPGLGRPPGGRNGNPLQCSCLENSMFRGAWWARAHGVTKSQTDEAISHAGPQHLTHLTGFPLVFRDMAGEMAEIYKHLKSSPSGPEKMHSFRKTRGGNKYKTMAAGVQRPSSPRSPQGSKRHWQQ